MRIENDTLTTEITRSGSARRNEEAPAKFSDVLASAVSEETAAAAPKTAQPVKVDAAPKIADAALLGDVGGLLDSLDAYARALGDPGRTLKDVAPLAEDLARRADDLSGRLPASGEDELVDLAWQAVSQAQAESIKFQRGDYV